jgi:hypothetical protein
LVEPLSFKHAIATRNALAFEDDGNRATMDSESVCQFIDRGTITVRLYKASQFVGQQPAPSSAGFEFEPISGLN